MMKTVFMKYGRGRNSLETYLSVGFWDQSIGNTVRDAVADTIPT